MQLNDYEIRHNELVRALAPECTLFLKRDSSFPLDKPCTVALFGNGARSTIRGGTGSGDVNSRFSVSIEEGLEEAGFTITSKKWLDRYTNLKAELKDAWVKDLKKKSKGLSSITNLLGAVMPEPEYVLPLDYDADACIYVLSRISGEGSDRTFSRGDFKLTETEVRDILELNSKFEKFMLVLNTGGVIDLSEILEVKNIFLLSQIGALSGNVLSDIILGKSCPSGKLTTTWAASYPEKGSFGEMDDSFYKEGIYVGYRYFDTVNESPVFPFGFGLSYTDFAVSDAKASLEGTRVKVSCLVKNTGAFKGREVVQLYVSSPSVKLDQPYQALCAFTKTDEILPGKSVEVTLSFDMSEIASYSTALESYILEEGSYVLRLGSSSRNTSVAAVVQLDSQAVVKKAKNVLGDCGFEDFVPEKCEAEVLPEGTAVLKLSSAAFKTETVEYGKQPEKEEFVKSLSDNEICYLNIGRFKTGPLSIIGNASRKVAGAAGDFTDQLLEKGFPVTTLADGPAGLRLNRKYFIDKDGCAVPVGNDAIAMLADFMPDFILKMMAMTAKKPKKNQEILEQYCTMIPIGTAVAQSFNTEVAKAFGDLVGSEMELFKVDVWLAPAMNIHRDIRCGRNFEYYSEDPLLSGKIAAAITCGVQSHPGRAVTVKHYAANNQENNRYGNNSHVSERAMREIYLKGFGIAVREASPKCVMTSYNLLNGQHTSEHKGLVESVLRDEFGFDGVVMTDWIVGGMESHGKYGSPSSCGIAMAGGDVMMPGSEGDYKNLLSGLKKGLVTRDQLEINASRMYRLARGLSEAQKNL